MNQLNIKNRIEVASNVAVVVTAAVVLFSFARNYLLTTPRVLPQGGLKEGAQLPPLPGVDLTKSQKTLLVALDSNCGYCTESLPVFKSIADKLRNGPNDTRMIAVFPGADEQAKRYARQNGLNLDTVFGVDLKMLNLNASPAMILVDNNGMILDFWIGKPSKEAEEQVISASVGAKGR